MLIDGARVTVDPTKHQFKKLSRDLGLSDFKLSLASSTPDEDAPRDFTLSAYKYDANDEKYVCVSLCKITRQEFWLPDVLSIETLRSVNESRGWTASIVWPTVFYHGSPYVGSDPLKSARLHKFLLNELGLDEALPAFEYAIKDLGFLGNRELARLNWHKVRIAFRIQCLAYYWYGVVWAPGRAAHARLLREYDAGL